jgi:hypothetical protein
MMFVIQRDLKTTNDKIRAVVIEKNLHEDQIKMIRKYDADCGETYNPNNKIKTIMAVHANCTEIMEPFEFSKANTWT